MELQGRTVVITGAAGGIGRACARAFAAQGARLVLADRDEERVREAAEEIGAVAIAVDIGHERGVRELIDGAQRHFGPIDLFFSNAGIGGPPGGPEAPDAALQLTWEVNVMAHVWAARGAASGDGRPRRRLSRLDRLGGGTAHPAVGARLLDDQARPPSRWPSGCRSPTPTRGSRSPASAPRGSTPRCSTRRARIRSALPRCWPRASSSPRTLPRWWWRGSATSGS